MNFNGYLNTFKNFQEKVTLEVGVPLKDVVLFGIAFEQELENADFKGHKGNENGTLKLEDINLNSFKSRLESNEFLDFWIFEDPEEAKRVALTMLMIQSRQGFEDETLAREAAEEGYDFY